MLLRDVFEEFRERRFVFVEPGGSNGDYLIYASARKLANEIDIEYRSCTRACEDSHGRLDKKTAAIASAR
jgi:hypothetical protein